MKMLKNQTGFSVIEALLILVVVGILGFTGWFVYHSKQATDKTLANTGNSNVQTKQSTTEQNKKTATTVQSTSEAKFLIIKEWGIKIPYSSNDTLSYVLKGQNSAQIASANLATNYGCNEYGSGSIGRSLGTDEDSNSGTTVAQEATQNPEMYVKLSNYYYNFAHDQAACSMSVTVAAQNAANDFLKSILPNIETE